jgi:hypothetical protein
MFVSDRRLAVVRNISFYTSFSDDIKAQLFTTISYRFFMVMFLICTAILCYFFHTFLYFWILKRRKSSLCSHLSTAAIPRVSSGLCFVGWGDGGMDGKWIRSGIMRNA